MKKLMILFLAISMFLTSCVSDQTGKTADEAPETSIASESEKNQTVNASSEGTPDPASTENVEISIQKTASTTLPSASTERTHEPSQTVSPVTPPTPTPATVTTESSESVEPIFPGIYDNNFYANGYDNGEVFGGYTALSILADLKQYELDDWILKTRPDDGRYISHMGWEQCRLYYTSLPHYPEKKYFYIQMSGFDQYIDRVSEGDKEYRNIEWAKNYDDQSVDGYRAEVWYRLAFDSFVPKPGGSILDYIYCGETDPVNNIWYKSSDAEVTIFQSQLSPDLSAIIDSPHMEARTKEFFSTHDKDRCILQIALLFFRVADNPFDEKIVRWTTAFLSAPIHKQGEAYSGIEDLAQGPDGEIDFSEESVDITRTLKEDDFYDYYYVGNDYPCFDFSEFFERVSRDDLKKVLFIPE